MEDGLKPVEYLQEHIEELGVTVWSRQILDSLQNSLSTLRERGNKAQKDFVSDNQIQLLRKEITDVERQMQNLDNIKITPIQNSERYYVLGRLKEFVEALKNLHDEIPTEKPTNRRGSRWTNSQTSGKNYRGNKGTKDNSSWGRT